MYIFQFYDRNFSEGYEGEKHQYGDLSTCTVK